LYIQTGSGNTLYLLEGSQNTMYAASPTLHSWQINNSEKMRLDSSGNLGVGQTSPQARLDVRASNIAIGVTALSTAQGQAFVGTTNNWGQDIGGTLALGGAQNSGTLTQTFASISGRRESSLGYIYTGYLQFAVSDGANMVERARIDSSGNVGIGTTAPASPLHVEVPNATAYDSTNTLVSGQTARISNENTTAGVSANLLFVAKGAGGGNGLGSISGVNTGTGSLALTFATRNSSSNVTERMRISSPGNLLIGTTTDIPGTGGLRVQGNFSFGTSSVVATTGNYTVADGVSSITFYSLSGTATLTLPSAGTHAGRMIWVRTQSTQAVISASANVTALANGTAGTAILSASQGKWALLAADGSFWNIIAAN
jgi:hypothetical protein